MSWTCILTRAAEDSESLADDLANAGITEVFSFPCLEFVAPADNCAALDMAIRRNNEYAWVVFLSQKSAEVFFGRLISLGGHTFHLHTGLKIATIGEATRKYIEGEIGFPVDFVPSRFNSEVFIDEFSKELRDSGLGLGSGLRVLLPRTAMVSDDFASRLETSSAVHVDVVDAYSTRAPEPGSLVDLKQALKSDIALLCFTSSQTVRNFVTMTASLDKELLRHAQIISLGPKTTKTISEYPQCFDLRKLREANPSTIETMLSVIKSSRDETRS